MFSFAPASVRGEEDYTKFGSAPAVFTWSGADSSFTNGVFARFDVTTGKDVPETYSGLSGYRTVPGWEGAFVPKFWWLFATAFDGSAMPYVTGSGYVLRFANPAEPGSQIMPPAALTVGGLIVESGAENITFGSTGAKAAKLSVGVDSETSVNYIDIRENFTLSGTIDRILGKVELSVAEGKIFRATSLAVPAATDNPSVPPTLKFVGEGSLVGKVTAANCAVLDFSAQPTSRTSPFLMSALTIGTMTRLILPTDLAAATPYALCSGALDATDGVYAVAKGEGEFFLADLAFSAGAVSYAEAEVNRATVSANVSWSSLAWQGGYVAGRPVQLILTDDVKVTVDTSSLDIPALLVSGGHRLTLVNRKGASIAKVFLGRGSNVDLVIDGVSAGFGADLSVPAGAPYATVLQGSPLLSSPTNWNSGKISVAGRLVTRGGLTVAAGLLNLSPGAVLTVSSGRLDVKSTGTCTWTGATFDLAGELALGSGEWKTTSGSRIVLRDGGAIVADGYASASLNMAGPTLLTVCADAEARLAAGLKTVTNAVAVRLESASSLAVTEAVGRSVVDVAHVAGTGALSVECTNNVTGAAYRLRDVSGFDGRLDVGSTRASVLLGDANLLAESAIVVPVDYTLDSKRDWSAPVVRLGATFNVNGRVGDPLFRVLGDDVSFDEVRIALTPPEGEPVICALGFDGTSRQLYLVQLPAPPHFDISDVSLRYSTDFTNGAVTVTVDNYWPGHDFEGSVNAEFYVYDAHGVLVGYGSSNLSSNGVCKVGDVHLPKGQGGDYRCEVTVKSINSKTGEEELLYDSAAAAPAVHWHGNWFHEDAASFPAVPGKSSFGTWSYKSGDAEVKSSKIEINTTESVDNKVVFSPDDDYTNDLVRVQTVLRLDGAWDTNSLPAVSSRRMAGITLVAEGDVSCTYAVWLPTENRFERVYGSAPADVTAEILVDVLFNYRTGFVTYCVDGAALTNALGISSFPMAERHRAPGRTFAFQGCGAVTTLDGERYNSTLAAVCKDGVTNEYQSVDEAVAAAKAVGADKVTLLWDASWRPVDVRLGEQFTFDNNGHQLVLDGSAVEALRRTGYRVVDNGGGSYTVDVITFDLTYAANGADSGEMDTQHFSVTNMVLDLLPNQFVRETFDFAAWNMAADGSGPTNWSDGARVDLTPYGYSNMTLYAQWTVAVRKIIIEPADEFVYVESVYTNGAPSLAARYFQDNAAKATGRVEVPIESGCDIVIRFSTDIEKQLTHDTHSLSNVLDTLTLPYATLPKIVSPIPPLPEDQLAWALRHNIPLEDVAASPYAQASCDLDLDHLLTNDSTITFSSFTALSDGCAFTLLVDGQPLTDQAKIASMVRVLRNFAEGWKTPAPETVTVGAGGRVEIKTGEPVSLFKIVIP